MSDQNEREAYNEAAREYYEGKEREEMDRPLFTQREMDAAISAAVQEERKAIKAHIDSEAFMPSKEYDRASHRIDAWESGVCDVVEYLDSRGPAPAVVCPECDGERWHEYENPLTGEITNRTPCATCNGAEEVPGPAPAVDVMAPPPDAAIVERCARIAEEPSGYWTIGSERRPYWDGNEKAKAIRALATPTRKEND